VFEDFTRDLMYCDLLRDRVLNRKIWCALYFYEIDVEHLHLFRMLKFPRIFHIPPPLGDHACAKPDYGTSNMTHRLCTHRLHRLKMA